MKYAPLVRTTLVPTTFAILLSACGNSSTEDGQVKPSTGATSGEVLDHTPQETKEMSVETTRHPQDFNDATHIRHVAEHVHGGAKLALALDGNRLVIELETPLFNLTGFEYAPLTEDEKTLVKSTQATLSRPADLFTFNSSAGCAPTPAHVNVVLYGADRPTYEHAHEHENPAQQDHRDVIIDYVYACTSPQELTSVSVNLFERFPDMTELDTIYLGPNTQLQSTLTQRKRALNLKN